MKASESSRRPTDRPGAGPLFEEHVGIDYSGAGMPDERCSGLRVFRSAGGGAPVEERPGGPGRSRWSRRALADWLTHLLGRPGPVVVGIDHCFSFPQAYLDRHGLRSWEGFLAHLCARWATHERSVESCRAANPDVREDRGALRRCERWTSSAKSVFLWDVNGSVAKSTRAGLPWLRQLRREHGGVVHFWPFDGWRVPPGKHVVAEVYPSIFRNRFPPVPAARWNPHQRDAFAIAEWLRTRDAAGLLARYFEPGLTAEEREVASAEGWILGVL